MMHTQRAPANLEPRHAALPNLPPSPPPPSKANLKAWWNQFNFVQRAKKAKEQGPVPYGRGEFRCRCLQPVAIAHRAQTTALYTPYLACLSERA